MRQYEIFEVKIQGEEPKGSQVEVDVKGRFFHNGTEQIVRGFYAGEDTYIVRFYPEEAGSYTYQIEGVAGAVSEEACIECKPTEKIGMVWCARMKHISAMRTERGFIRLEQRYMRFPIRRMNGWQRHLKHWQKHRLIRSGCVCSRNITTIITMNPLIMHLKKQREKWDVHKPCMAFWDRLESHIRKLDEMGIQCDLILFHPYDNWGFSKLSREEALVYLDYVTRRLGAFPNVWWSLANEYDLMDYEMEDWECCAQFLHDHDGWGHLLSNHQIVCPWDFSNPNTTHICHQTSELDFLSGQIRKFQKPLMVDECCYEGNIPWDWGNISGFELVHRFWTVCMQGGYCTHGETYLNEEEVLWWSKGGKLVGESPARIGFLREILESLPGPLTFSGRDITEESFEQMKKAIPEEARQEPFVKLMLKLPWEEARGMANAGREMAGNCGDDVYMKYYGRHRKSSGTFALPKENRYDVEVIDVWEMTRTKVLEQVNGEVQVPLPGKEGIAVLARKR